MAGFWRIPGKTHGRIGKCGTSTWVTKHVTEYKSYTFLPFIQGIERFRPLKEPRGPLQDVL